MKFKLFIAVLAAQCVWLLGICAVQERALHAGKTILLETAPVDPRDMLRGDYLILNYKISTVPRSSFTPALKLSPGAGTTVYVCVAPSGPGGFYQVTRASTEELTPGGDEVLLRGKVAGNWWNGASDVRVEYGFERFYVAEGTGHPPTGTKLTVQASVSSSARAIIRQLLADGKPYVDVVKKER
jgi:uncharacterized membrane-anchored protein